MCVHMRCFSLNQISCHFSQVQVGSTIVAVVKVMDGSGRSFPSSQFKHMNLVPYPKTAHIDVQ